MSEDEQAFKKARHEPIRNEDDGLFVGDTFLLVCMQVPLSTIAALSQVQHQWRFFANQHAPEILLNHPGMPWQLQKRFRGMFDEDGKGTRDVDGTLQVCGRPWFSYLSFFEGLIDFGARPREDSDSFFDYVACHLLILPPRVAAIVGQCFLPLYSDTTEEGEYGSIDLTLVANELRQRVIPMLVPLNRDIKAMKRWKPHPDLLDSLSLFQFCLPPKARGYFLGVESLETLFTLFRFRHNWSWLLKLFKRGHSTAAMLSTSGPLDFLRYMTQNKLKEEDVAHVCALASAYGFNEYEARLSTEIKDSQGNDDFRQDIWKLFTKLRTKPWFDDKQRDIWRRIMGSFFIPFY